MIGLKITSNLIEALCFSYFIASKLNITPRSKFIVITLIIQFCILSLFDCLNSNGLLLTIVIISYMIISIYLFKKDITFNYIYIVIVYNSFIIFSAIIGIIVQQMLIRFITYNLTDSYIIGCVVSKSTQILGTFLVVNKDTNYTYSFKLSEWKHLLIFTSILLFCIVFQAYSLVISDFGLIQSSIILLFLLILSSVFLIIIHKINIINKNKIERDELQQLRQFNQEKIKVLNKIKNDIDAIEHRNFYIMIKINNALLKQDYKEISNIINTYLSKEIKTNTFIDTQNPMFDYLITLVINKLKRSNNIDINVCIFISQNKFYNDFEFLNTIVALLYEFRNCKHFTILMNEINGSVIIRILYSNGAININDIYQLLSYASKHMNCKYDITNHKENGIILSFVIK